jgi:hypothetical protein
MVLVCRKSALHYKFITFQSQLNHVICKYDKYLTDPRVSQTTEAETRDEKSTGKIITLMQFCDEYSHYLSG